MSKAENALAILIIHYLRQESAAYSIRADAILEKLEAELLSLLPENPWTNKIIADEDMPIGKKRRLKAQQLGFDTAKKQMEQSIKDMFKSNDWNNNQPNSKKGLDSGIRKAAS